MEVNQLESVAVDGAQGGRSIARTKRGRTVLVSVSLLAAISISLLVSSHFLPVVMDDALVSYRYTDRLLEGKGLTWNDGELVEGYSNLLWVLLLALGGLIQPNLVMVGWVMGAMANVATLGSIVWAFGRSPNVSITAVVGGLLLVAGSECFAFWGIAGLETALLSALLSWALALAYRMPANKSGPGELYASLLFGLLAITRPDGALLGVSAAIGELARSGVTRIAIRRAISFAGAPVGFVALQLAFRLAYYGSPIPNTAFAKLAFSFERTLDGGLYVTEGVMINAALFVTMAAAVVVLWREYRWELFRQNAGSIVPGVAWLVYICAIGGDWFPFERQWQPAFICFAFATSGLLSMLSPIRPWRLIPLAVVVLILHLAAQATRNPYLPEFKHMDRYMETVRRDLRKADPTGRAERELLSAGTPSREASLSGWQREFHQCIALGQLLHTAFKTEQPLIAVNGAGCLPYNSRLPSIDMFGMADAYIAHHPPPDMGRGPLGHELGDGAYVLSRKPDLIVFCDLGLFGVVVPCSRSERQIVESPDLLTYYRLIFYRAGQFELQAWTRVENGRLGIKRAENEIYIPGFLLATTPGARGILDSEGKLAAELREGDARIENVVLPQGTWEVSLKADSVGKLQLATLPTSGSTTLGPRSLRLALEGGPRSFRVFGAPGLIYAVIVKRVPGDTKREGQSSLSQNR